MIVRRQSAVIRCLTAFCDFEPRVQNFAFQSHQCASRKHNREHKNNRSKKTFIGNKEKSLCSCHSPVYEIKPSAFTPTAVYPSLSITCTTAMHIKCDDKSEQQTWVRTRSPPLPPSAQNPFPQSARHSTELAAIERGEILARNAKNERRNHRANTEHTRTTHALASPSQIWPRDSFIF